MTNVDESMIDGDTLDAKFSAKNKVTQFIILKEPEKKEGDYGKFYQCSVQCNDISHSLKTFKLKNTNLKIMVEIFGLDMGDWLGKKICIGKAFYNKNGVQTPYLVIDKDLTIEANMTKQTAIDQE